MTVKHIAMSVIGGFIAGAISTIFAVERWVEKNWRRI